MRAHHLIPLPPSLLLVTVAAPAHAAVTATYVPDGGLYTLVGDTAANTLSVSCCRQQHDPGLDAERPVRRRQGDRRVVGRLRHRRLARHGQPVRVTATDFPAVTSVTIWADAENTTADTLTGSTLNDRIYADFLDQVFGGAGNDYFEGGERVEGGDGDDVFFGVGATSVRTVAR